jgi:hypothetical protein
MDKVKTNHYVQKGGRLINSIEEIKSDDTDLIFYDLYDQPIEQGVLPAGLKKFGISF